MKSLKKFLLWSTPLTILPIAFVSSCNSSENVSFVTAAMPSDDKVLPGFTIDHQKFEEAKAKQYEISESSDKDSVSFENDFVKFTFDQRSLASDVLNGKDNAKKFMLESLESMNVTSLAHLNSEGKKEILIKGVDSSDVDAGGYSPETITIVLAKNIFAKNFDAAMKVYENVVVHEWGHFETVMPVNSLYGTNDMGAHLDESWKDFLKDLEGYEDFKAKANFTDENYPWNLDADKVMFSHPERFFGLSQNQKQYWKDNVTDKIEKAEKMDGVEAHDLSSLLAEIITRMQMTYIVRYKASDILNPDYLLPITTRNMFANQLEIAKIFNFNFYDENKDAIALDFMKSILKNFYGVGNTSGVQITYTNGKIASVAYDSLGMPYEVLADKLSVLDKDTNQKYEIELKHEVLPFAFDRNPFLESSREYEGTINSTYGYDQNITSKAISSKNLEFNLEDKSGNVIPDLVNVVSFVNK